MLVSTCLARMSIFKNMRFFVAFDKLQNAGYRAIARSFNVARTTASESKLIYRERFLILTNCFLEWKMILDFEPKKTSLTIIFPVYICF